MSSSLDVHSSLAKRLASSWLTRDLDRDALDRLARLGRVVSVAAGSTLFAEAEPTRECGIVLDGRVALRLRVPEQGMVTILTVDPGDILGWSALVPPYRATSTAVTLEPTEICWFEGERLRAELGQQPTLAAAFYPVVLKAVARRLEGTRMQLLDLFTQRGVEPW